MATTPQDIQTPVLAEVLDVLSCMKPAQTVYKGPWGNGRPSTSSRNVKLQIVLLNLRYIERRSSVSHSEVNLAMGSG